MFPSGQNFGQQAPSDQYSDQYADQQAPSDQYSDQYADQQIVPLDQVDQCCIDQEMVQSDEHSGQHLGQQMVQSDEHLGQQRPIRILIGQFPEHNGIKEFFVPFFTKFGDVTHFEIMNRNALIYMTQQEAAEKAIKALHNFYGMPKVKSFIVEQNSIREINIEQ